MSKESLSIDRMVGEHEDLSPQMMADAIRLRQDVQNAIIANRGNTQGDIYTTAGRVSNCVDPESGEIVSDERLLGLQEAWQSDDIWE